MTLSDYLQAKGLSDAEFGQRVQLSRSAVSRIRRGLADPPLSTIQRIVAATNGAVTLEGFQVTRVLTVSDEQRAS